MSATLAAREPVVRYLATPPLLQHFDRVAKAPGGVARLRELILTLAVQGKLVPQDPADEPASVLLERIRADKARLAKEGKIRKEKPLAAITEEEKPFALPGNWEWVRFGDISINRDGERIPVSSAARENREKIYDYYGASGVIDKIDSYLFDKTLLLIGEDGANLINRSTPIAFLAYGKYWVNNHAHVIDTTPPDLMNYLSLFINAISLEPYVTGTAQPKMNQAKLNSILVALPPFAEQSRIVARVEELMALCDALEDKGRLAAEQHERLAGALFDALANSASAEEAAGHWQRIAAHFDLLLTQIPAVDRLEQAILQLAVRGRLVPQDPADEPASALLQKIRSEKDRLIATGQRKRDKPLPPISDEEKPFELPEGWEWARFGDLILSSDAGWSPCCESTPREGNQWGVLKVSAVSWGEFRPEENKALPSGLPPKPEFEVKAGDFLLSRANTEELVARSVVAWKPPKHLMMSDKLIRLRLSNHIDKGFYCEINNSRLSREHYIANASGTSSSMKNVSREVVLKLVVPVPPLAEQSRIVARVAELRALCAQLRERLAATDQTQARLAGALLEQAVA